MHNEKYFTCEQSKWAHATVTMKKDGVSTHKNEHVIDLE